MGKIIKVGKNIAAKNATVIDWNKQTFNSRNN
jgi:hypothetical protein